MAFDQITGGETTFSVPAVVAGANGQLLFHNNSAAPITGTVSIQRPAGTEVGSFDLDLEPGEAFVTRNATAATSWIYTGGFKHTIVKASQPHEYASDVEGAVAATGQAATFHLAAVSVQVI